MHNILPGGGRTKPSLLIKEIQTILYLHMFLTQIFKLMNEQICCAAELTWHIYNTQILESQVHKILKAVPFVSKQMKQATLSIDASFSSQ